MKPTISLIAIALLAGCGGRYATTPVTQEQTIALDRAGQEFVSGGFIQNGVIITPAWNYFYGQTDGYVPAPTAASDETPADVLLGAPVSADEAGAPTLVSAHADLDRRDILAAFERIDWLRVDPLPDGPAAPNPPVTFFRAGSAALSPVSREKILDFAAGVGSRPERLLVVTGFTSAEGPAALNERLARERAGVVRHALLRGGVEDDAAAGIGAPQCCYRDDNRTSAGRAKNRRAEIQQTGPHVAASDNEAVALAMARVLRTARGEAVGLRVHALALGDEEARRLANEVRAALDASALTGHGAVPAKVGMTARGDQVSVILEIIK